MNKKLFSINTGDPAFDPNEPLSVNGYLFMPTNGGPADRKFTIGGGGPKVMVEVKRRKLVQARP